jgi:hypothetical protein
MSRTYSRYSAPSGASAGSYGDTPSYQGYDRGYSYGSSTGYGSNAFTSERTHSYGSYSSYGSATDLADRPAGEYTSTYGDTDRFTAADAEYAGGDADAAYDEYDDDDEIYEYDDAIDRRWVWVAGVAGAILLVAVICTVVILGGGDSGPVTAPIAPPSTSQSATPTASAAPSAAPRPRVTAAPPSASLAPETVTTVTPSAAAPTPTAAVPPVDPAAVPAAPVPNTVTYRITGNKSLLDLVTVIYTDGQGALQTDVNVALPWAKTVTLNPGVTLSSVTATSVTGQLNCSISDGSGQAVAVQSNNTMITTCTK